MNKGVYAYAVLANVSGEPADIILGLRPIFSVAISSIQGNEYDAKAISRAMNNEFGIYMHPWAVDALSDKLVEMGVLEVDAEFKGKKILKLVKSEEEAVDTSKAEDLVLKFRIFCVSVLDGIIPFDPESVLFSFLSSKSLSESDEFIDSVNDDDPNVLAAAFVEHCSENDKDSFDYIESIYEGIIYGEAVVFLHDGGPDISLAGINVMLDTPVALSYLGLSSKEESDYVLELINDIKYKKANLCIFPHNVEEFSQVLNSTLHEYRSGRAEGELARRMRSDSSVCAYAQGVSLDIEGALKKKGISIRKLSNEASYADPEVRKKWSRVLNYKKRTRAKEFDIKTLEYMHEFSSDSVPVQKFYRKKNLFLTLNRKLMVCSAFSSGGARYTPSIVTLEQLAVMLWLSFGGGVRGKISKAKLAAKCSKALDPKFSLLDAARNFLGNASLDAAQQFDALMTDSKAAHLLTVKTLGNPARVHEKTDLLKEMMDAAILDEKNKYDDKIKEKEEEINEMRSRQDQLESSIKNKEKAEMDKILRRAKLGAGAVEVLVCLFVAFLVGRFQPFNAFWLTFFSVLFAASFVAKYINKINVFVTRLILKVSRNKGDYFYLCLDEVDVLEKP